MYAETHDLPLPPESAPLRAWARLVTLTFIGFTLLDLAWQAWRRLAMFQSGRFTAGHTLSVLLLSLPFIVALTLPAAVLAATAHAFSRPNPGGGSQRGLAPMLRPTLLAALGLSLLTFGFVDQVLPRTNSALRRLLIAISRGTPDELPTDIPRGNREMTSAEMFTVVREAEFQLAKATATADVETMKAAAERATSYRLEIQKKRAIAATCLVFALLGAATGISLTGRPWWVPAGAAVGLFAVFYVGLVEGEQLVDAGKVSAGLGAWGGTLVLALLGLLLLWRQGRRATHAPITMN